MIEYEIITYGGGNYLVETFNYLKLLFGSGEFDTLARIAGVVGTLLIMAAAVGFKQPASIDWMYFIRFGFVYLALLTPKADVTIVDRVTPVSAGSVVVESVPLAVAALASYTSRIGDGLTRMYETYSTVPGDLKYEKHGMLFGSSMLSALEETRFTSPTFDENMAHYIGNCALPLVARGNVTIDELENSGDIWQIFKDRAQENRFVQYRTGYVIDTPSCREAAGYLDGSMPTEELGAKKELGRAMFAGINETAATAAVATALPVAIQEMVKVSRDASNVVRQAMMLNAVRDNLANVPPSSETAGLAVAYAQAAAEESQRKSYLVMGNVAGRTLPITHAVLEGMVYGLFPFIAILMLMPWGFQALGQYIFTMVWLQTWPVVYAILNSIMYFYGQGKNGAVSTLANGINDYTMSTAAGVHNVNSDIVAVAGYLSISVPMIAWMLVRGGAVAGTHLAQGIMAPAMSAAQAEASAAAKGNFNQGNVNMENVSHSNLSTWKFDNNLMFRSGQKSIQRPSGAIDGATGTDVGTVDQSQQRSNTTVKAAVTEGYAASMEAGATAKTEAGLAYVKKAGDATVSALNDSTGANASTGVSATTLKALSENRGLIDQIKTGTALTDEQAAKLAIGASLGTKGTPLGMLLKPLGLSAEISAEASGSSALRKLHETGQLAEIGTKITTNNDIARRDTTGLDASVVASLNTAVTSGNEAASNFATAEAATKTAKLARSGDVKATTDIETYVVRKIMDAGGGKLFDDPSNKDNQTKLQQMATTFATDYAKQDLDRLARGDDQVINGLHGYQKMKIGRVRFRNDQAADKGSPEVDYENNKGKIEGGVLKPSSTIYKKADKTIKETEIKVDAGERKLTGATDKKQTEVEREINEARPVLRAVMNTAPVDTAKKSLTGEGRFDVKKGEKDDTSKYPRG